MKVFEVLNLKDGIEKLKDEKFPISVSYALITNFKKLSEVYEVYYNKNMALFEKYGEKTTDDNGNPVIKILPENDDKYRDELNTILNEDVDLELSKIKLEKLLSDDSIKVNLKELSAIDLIIEK